MIGLNLLLCAVSLVLPREFLTESWGKAHDGGEIRQTPEGRVFAAPRPKAGVSGEFAVGADWGVVELSCEYRAKDIVPGEKFYENGRILQEFVGVGGKRVGAWPATLGVTGTTDGWRPWSARYRVPDGAKRYKVNFSNIAKSGSVEYRKASLRLVKSRADLAPHANLISSHSGVSKLYWYQATDANYKNGDGFAIIHGGSAGKSALKAYRTLTKWRPVGSQILPGKFKDLETGLYHARWRRPDGRLAGEVWTVMKPRTETMDLGREIFSLAITSEGGWRSRRRTTGGRFPCRTR